jgi:ring-1,2-phenylacetyl-CoA epoxidase subunit PaaD
VTTHRTMMLTAENIRSIISTIPDPEIPVISIEDLGILRAVEERDGRTIVTITPTYSGCPAMKAIENDILARLKEVGIEDAEVRLVYSPAWTTDWMSEEAKLKLEEYGISPPGKTGSGDRVIICPRCFSKDTELISMFSSTACKSLYRCKTCLEPFDHFKCH